MKNKNYSLIVTAFLLTASIFSCKKNIAPQQTQANQSELLKTFRVVGYLNTWSNFPNSINSVDLSKVTHINIAFANPNASGNLTSFSGMSTVTTKAHSSNVKVLISLGGADLGGSDSYWKNLTNASNVNAFCNKILTYLQTNNLDGVDIDLEGLLS